MLPNRRPNFVHFCVAAEAKKGGIFVPLFRCFVLFTTFDFPPDEITQCFPKKQSKCSIWVSVIFICLPCISIIAPTTSQEGAGEEAGQSTEATRARSGGETVAAEANGRKGAHVTERRASAILGVNVVIPEPCPSLEDDTVTLARPQGIESWVVREFSRMAIFFPHHSNPPPHLNSLLVE